MSWVRVPSATHAKRGNSIRMFLFFVVYKGFTKCILKICHKEQLYK
uniref:Uncharacterized protein n=1 Tax=Siphoviridae sp. ctvBz3 TaxID=2825720 RepID=A0A8S5TXS0_9CAUD|nr:MAG TPA: hypothetical protein [Siphoviridae sp. ctvBz3]